MGKGLSERNPLVRCVITHISRIMATYRAWEDWTECDFATVRSGLDPWQLQNRAIPNHLFISLSLLVGKNAIKVAELDGTNAMTLLSNGIDKPRAIVVDPAEG